MPVPGIVHMPHPLPRAAPLKPPCRYLGTVAVTRLLAARVGPHRQGKSTKPYPRPVGVYVCAWYHAVLDARTTSYPT